MIDPVPVRVWRGIPFARLAHAFAAPELVVGAAMPEPGGAFGPAPAQREIPGFDLPGGQSSTDCLTLNVWAPDGAADLPVAVWIFGGGFEVGTAGTPWFDGEALAQAAGCVVVTVNYRVGAFGFAHLSRHGGALAAAHDLGLQDVRAALRWVDRAVAGFGGDPGRVTVIGQSAGAFLAAAAAVAPDEPRPRAIACFSGGASRIVGEADAAAFGDAILARLGIADDPDAIVTTDAAAIIAAQEAVAPRDLGVRNGLRPVGFGVAADTGADAPLVPQHPLDAIAGGALAGTFVLAAAGTDEMDGFDPAAVPPLEGGLADAVAALAGPDAAALAVAYTDSDPAAAWRRVLGDYIYRLPAARMVRAQQAAGGHAAYLEIGHEGAVAGGHGVEVPGIFARGDDERSRAVQRTVVELIRTGRVNGGDLAQPLSAGEVPATSLAPEALLAVWEGVARP
ncbi:carboxylesterase family protein [Microbacterium sp. NPDC091313]